MAGRWPWRAYNQSFVKNEKVSCGLKTSKARSQPEPKIKQKMKNS